MEEKIGRLEREDPMFQNLKSPKTIAVKESSIKDQESVASSRRNIKVSIRSGGITSNKKIQQSDSVNDDNQLLVGTPDDHASQP